MAPLQDKAARPAQQRVAALLFTDIVDSTALAASMANLRWADLMARHDDRTWAAVDRCGGEVIDLTGDGVFALFDRPAQAVACAESVHAEMRALGLRLRAGVHVGEVAVRQGRVTGLAVHIAERIAATAQPGETLASGAVRDLHTSAATAFIDRGVHTLRGVPQRWQLFSVQPAMASNGPFAPRRMARVARRSGHRYPAARLAALPALRHPTEPCAPAAATETESGGGSE